MGGGLSAQMSWEMPGSAHGVCHSGRVSRFAIAHVGLGVEMCAGKVENTAWKGDCLRRCRVKGEEENMGGEETDSSLALRMTKGRSE